MPDTDRPRAPAPADWSEAFAALAHESPGNDGWQRLTRALDSTATDSAARTLPPKARTTTHRRARWPLWLATAAAVSAVALIPLVRQGAAPVQTGSPRATDVAVQSPPPATTADTTDAGIATSAPSTTAATAIATTQPAERHVARRKPVGMPTRKPVPVTAPLPTRSESGTRVASTDAMTHDAATAAVDRSTAALADSAVAIQSLQAESAQLEALVALARDERVSSASGAALGVELDERIGRIDASLSQPGLADSERAGLWQQRVDAMRELAGIETTQRWLVTRGERYDGALVSVD